MKVIESSLFRAICAIVVGVLLIKFPENIMTWLVVCIGSMFFLPGLISVITYFTTRKREPETLTDAEGKEVTVGRPMFPIVGFGSTVLGLILMIMPNTFTSSLMYVLGAIMILGAIGQYVMLINLHKMGNVSWGFYILPSLILLTGLFVIIYPLESASLPLLIIGVCCIVYGCTEFVYGMKAYLVRRKHDKTAAAANNENKEEETKTEAE